jgi:hypothetical protein
LGVPDVPGSPQARGSRNPEVPGRVGLPGRRLPRRVPDSPRPPHRTGTFVRLLKVRRTRRVRMDPLTKKLFFREKAARMREALARRQTAAIRSHMKTTLVEAADRVNEHSVVRKNCLVQVTCSRNAPVLKLVVRGLPSLPRRRRPLSPRPPRQWISTPRPRPTDRGKKNARPGKGPSARIGSLTGPSQHVCCGADLRRERTVCRSSVADLQG